MRQEGGTLVHSPGRTTTCKHVYIYNQSHPNARAQIPPPPHTHTHTQRERGGGHRRWSGRWCTGPRRRSPARARRCACRGTGPPPGTARTRRGRRRSRRSRSGTAGTAPAADVRRYYVTMYKSTSISVIASRGRQHSLRTDVGERGGGGGRAGGRASLVVDEAEAGRLAPEDLRAAAMTLPI